MKFDDITTLRCFKLIYETRSLTKSSEGIGLSKAALSKRLDAFELSLGYKLFSRTTRTMVPTQNADKLFPLVNDILERIDGLSSNVVPKSMAQSKIKITCTATMSQTFMGQVLQDFRKKHPGLVVELIVTDSVLELVEHGIDLAIRYNPAKNSTLVGKKIGPLRLVAVATPSYLKKHFQILKIEDLVQHDLLFIDHHVSVFSSFDKKKQEAFKAQRPFLTNDSPLITQLVHKGHGVAIRSYWDVLEGIRARKLALALPENTFKPQGDIWLLSGPDRLKSEAVRSLFEYLTQRLPEFIC